MNEGGVMIIKVSEPVICDITKFIEKSQYEHGWRYHKRQDSKLLIIVTFGDEHFHTGICVFKKLHKQCISFDEGYLVYQVTLT